MSMVNNKIINMDKLIDLLPKKFRMKDIVLTTGCFDILHKAHKDFLQAAKKQGDLLIVGLESDKRVKELKGRGRPINKWEERAKNLSLIQTVDYIFLLGTNINKRKGEIELLTQIKPKVLAVSENTPFLEVKKKLTDLSHIKLFIFPYNKHFSTTKIILSKTS